MEIRLAILFRYPQYLPVSTEVPDRLCSFRGATGNRRISRSSNEAEAEQPPLHGGSSLTKQKVLCCPLCISRRATWDLEDF
jgi:hypothetical protein